MPTTLHRSNSTSYVRPSLVDASIAAPFTLDQELKPFGRWVGEPVWVPPKGESKQLALTMLDHTRPFTSPEVRWATAIDRHREQCTQVREIDLSKASIRLPQGRFFVTVTEQQDFDKIEEQVPACVQTRLEEFLAGPGRKRGVKVYYLKPLCVESGDELILTTREDLTAAIERIRKEVLEEYRRHAVPHRTAAAVLGLANASLAVPRAVVNYFVARRQKSLAAYQAKLEFKRRKTALGAMRTLKKCRTTECSFDDMLALTNELDTRHVIHQYCSEQELSKAKREQMLQIAAGAVPWFVAMSLTASYFASIGLYLATATPPVLVCDPAFVAEMPDAPGVLLKIGHFDEVGGVTHVEI